MQTVTATRTQALHKGATTHAAAKKAAGKTTRARKAVDTTKFYVNALKEAGGFHKSSFHIEMAVCLAFYAEHKAADMSVKKLLRPIYERAGYDCKQPKGEDYKTVQRRISVAADLFAFLGGDETLHDWVEGATGAKMIDALVKELETRGLDNITAVKEASGKPATRQYKKKAAPQMPAPTETDMKLANEIGAGIAGRKALESAATSPVSMTRRIVDQLPPERIIRTEHIFCAIPLDATQDEVKALALSLLEFATTKMGQAQPEPTKLAA